ncbi:MAG: hypothetical protein HY064_01210 [Bacteroidetes bacterium]|nr:hypothetical protein [Bacteroidota bacterium]
MNWKLIFLLSLIGLAMAFATVFVLPGKYELFVWIAIIAFNVTVIVKKCSGKYFMHGLVVSLANCVWVTPAHILFYAQYMKLNPEMLAMNAHMPLPTHPRLMMLIMGPIIGIAFGIIQGGIAWGVSKLVKK